MELGSLVCLGGLVFGRFCFFGFYVRNGGVNGVAVYGWCWEMLRRCIGFGVGGFWFCGIDIIFRYYFRDIVYLRLKD